MTPVCILTDSTVQFATNDFPGRDLIHTIPLQPARIGEPIGREQGAAGRSHQPGNLRSSDSNLSVCVPSVDDFRQAFTKLGNSHQFVVAILMSGYLSATVQNAQAALDTMRGSAPVYVIDSQTTDIGMGLLVQLAAQAAQNGASALEINRLVRRSIPHIYTVFCLQSLGVFALSGHMDPSQAIVGEMLGLIPFFTMESGKFVPVQKARNIRQAADMLIEFVCEFDRVEHIALIQGNPPFHPETRNLHDRIKQAHPKSSLSEHSINPSLALLIGPRSLGLVVMEQPDEE